MPTVPEGSPPWLTLAAIAGAVLLAFAPLVVSKAKSARSTERPPTSSATDPEASTGRHGAGQPSPAPPTTAVDRADEYARQYIASLEARAGLAERRVESLQDEFDEFREQAFKDQLRMQTDLGSARAEIQTLRRQVDQMMQWRGGGIA